MPTRRLFLKRAGTATVFLSCPALLQACAGDQEDPDFTASGGSTPTGGGGTTTDTLPGVPAGNVADYAVGDLVAIVGERVCLGMDADGLYAMTTVCTHSGCDIGATGTVSDTGLVCSCHGSQFDVNGGVTNGPAVAALKHYLVVLEADGEIYIDDTTVVDAADRTAIA